MRDLLASAGNPGAPIGASPGSISGERQQVTALFYDLVGSTDLLASLDPEEFGRLQRVVHVAAAEAIREQSGHLDRIHGDGGCAYFGLPMPFEDAAESAITAAFQIIGRCRIVSGEMGVSLKVRVGIATGFVVVADARNASLPLEAEVIGLSPALAARIQSEAEPDSILVSDETYRLTKAVFQYEPIGVRQLKGFAAPVRLWRPIARRPHLDRFSSLRRTTSRFTGRTGELDHCRRRLTLALSGKGQVVFVNGEAGIGKSRLVLELRRELLAADCDIRILQCQPRGNTRPLHPFLDALQQAIGETGPAALGPDRTAIKQYVSKQNLDISDAAQDAIAFLFGGRDESFDDPPCPPDGGAVRVRGRAVSATIEFIAAWARLRPQMLVIEDLHWADTLTEAVVESLADAIRGRPVFVIVTSRDTIPNHLTGDENVGVLALSRLDAADIAQILASVWEDELPAGLAAFVYEKTEGVPLFAEELALLLKEQADGTETGVLDWQRALRDGNVLTLQDLVAARLAGLGELRRAAQIASVVGREFHLDLLSRVVDGVALPIPLSDALGRLVDAGIVRRRETAEGITYRFRHVLIQEGAYNSLLKSDRRDLHAKILEVIHTGGVPHLPNELLAWHCSQAGRLLEAAEYAIRAAEACVVRSAMQEAERLLAFAGEQLDRTPTASPQSIDLRIRLLAARGPVAAALFGRGAEQTRNVYEEGVALCHDRSDEDRAKWFPLYWGWWFTAPDYQTQQARSAILVSDLEGTADPEVRLQALHCAWATSFGAGRHEYCLDCVREGLTLYDEGRARHSRARYSGHDAKVCALGERALSSWFVGDETGSAASLDEMMRWAERIDHLESTLHALDYASGLMRYLNDYVGVVTAANRMGQVAAEHALPGAKAKAMIFRGWARALSGNLAGGAAEFEEGFALQREIGTEDNLSLYYDMRAEILTQARRFEEAVRILDDTIGRSNRSGQVFWAPELYRRRALLRRQLGQDVADVLADLQSALRLADAQAARSLATRARRDIDLLRSSHV